MKTINLSLVQLSFALEKRTYTNKKNETKKIKPNINYKFETPGINFACELYVDSEGELGITTINGVNPADSECFYTLEGFNKYEELKGLYGYLAVNYGFIPSSNILDSIAFDTIKSNQNGSFSDLQYDCDTLYFLDYSKIASGLFSNYWDQYIFDKTIVVSFKDILKIDLDVFGNTCYLSIFTKEDIFKVKISISDDKFEALVELKNVINSSILQHKAA